MLRSATEHYERQQVLTAAAVLAVRRGGGNLGGLARAIAALQILAARDAVDSIDPMLEEQGLAVAPTAAVAVTSFAGLASDGRPLVSLFEQAANTMALDRMAVTQVQDAARTAAGAAIVTRPGVGYVRMLNPPSCSRCVILAGRFYRWNADFPRHPNCDCRHIPSIENVAGDLTTDPGLYYDSLTEAERIKFAGSRANYRAIEDGADIAQVVNIYRPGRSGLSAAGSSLERVDGLKYTRAGSTLRSRFYQQQVGLGLRPAARADGSSLRLMPESIYRIARNQDEALQMLRANGWITDLDARTAGRAALDATRRTERSERRRERREQRRQDALAVASAPDVDELMALARAMRDRRRRTP